MRPFYFDGKVWRIVYTGNRLIRLQDNSGNTEIVDQTGLERMQLGIARGIQKIKIQK